MGGAMGEVEASRMGKAGDRDLEQFVCDFCGRTAAHVRRIALDRDYDRLQTPHLVRYACDSCSQDKERRRLERDGG